MLILSQDSRCIVNTDRPIFVVDNMVHYGEWNDGNGENWAWLGEYSSGERCSDIIEKIAEAYQNGNRLFEMPEF